MYTNEQAKQWDEIKGPGLYNVDGPTALEYLHERIRKLVVYGDGLDLKAVMLIGSEDNRDKFLQKQAELGSRKADEELKPFFLCLKDRVVPGQETYQCCLNSEDDTEKFCDFIRNSQELGYHRVSAVVVLNDADETKFIDRLLRIRYSTNEVTRFIELPVYVVMDCEENNFEKVAKESKPGVKQTIEIMWGDEMEEESVEWLVPEFVPLHQATAFSGEMDTRKSTLALDIAACASTWTPWFIQTETEKEEVTLPSGKKWRVPIARKPFMTLVAADEDSYKTTVLPRYLAAGGDRSCIGCLKLEVKNEKQGPDGLQEWYTTLSFDSHLNKLMDEIRRLGSKRGWPVSLLINDPIISRFGDKNYNSPQDARDIMAGLKKLCEELQITVINICHFNKTLGLTAKQKTAGSKALIEAHRMAWAFDLMEDDPKTTLIAPIKHNLLREAKSPKITTVDNGGYGVIKFLGYSAQTADERIEEKESKDRGNRKEIKKAILDVLRDGPKPAGHVCNELRDMGGIATLRRAAQSLKEEGKLQRSGNNNRNIIWQLATDQPTFDEVQR